MNDYDTMQRLAALTDDATVRRESGIWVARPWRGGPALGRSETLAGAVREMLEALEAPADEPDHDPAIDRAIEERAGWSRE